MQQPGHSTLMCQTGPHRQALVRKRPCCTSKWPRARPLGGERVSRPDCCLHWCQVEGIAVDTHVHRIANALGWTGVPTKTAQQTRRELENRIPRKFWGVINPLVVGACAIVLTCFHIARSADFPQGHAVIRGFGQELRENRSSILHKCLSCSHPRLALQLLADCGMQVRRELLDSYGTH